MRPGGQPDFAAIFLVVGAIVVVALVIMIFWTLLAERQCINPNGVEI
jgi:FtsZ-interacting cell division protein ZipA